MTAFREARRREGDLNARQREVLDLIVAGKTNAEIGETLGITLDGAKWNVSEILTKLGLDSREESADYWRWRNRGVRKLARATRGMVAGTALKVTAGAAGCAVVGVAALAIWLSVGTGERAATGATPGSFYLEASVVVRSDPSPQDIGRSIAGQAAPTGQPTENRFALRWWYQDLDHGRWELDALTPSLDQRDFVMVFDGKEQWSYDSSQNTYTSEPLQPMPPGLTVRPLMFSAMVGPYPAASIDEVVRMLKGDRADTRVELSGEATILGRRVTIVEYSPTSHSSIANADGTTSETSSGVGRFWIDPQTMFVLKNEVTGDQSFVGEVTKLEMGAAIPPDKLRFQPPKGASQTTSLSSMGSGTSHGVMRLSPGSPDVPDGFVPVHHLLGGFRVIGVEEGDDGNGKGIYSWTVQLEDNDGRTARIEQRLRADGLPAGLKAGERTGLPGGLQGYQSQEGERRILAFEKDGVSVTIASAALAFNDLMVIAAGMLAP